MTLARVTSSIIVASFLAGLPGPLWAGEDGNSPTPGLRAAADRAALRFVAEQPPVAPATARARQAVGAGGGSGVLIWTLVGTVASVATTYFVIKEVRKQTEKLSEQ